MTNDLDGPLNLTRFNLTNRMEELERLHAEFSGLRDNELLPERTAFHLTLACEEVVTNIIQYGYETVDGIHSISICIELNASDVYITIKDDGIPFNPLEAEQPDTLLMLDDRPIGGLGLHLVKQLVDDVSYVREEGYNCLHLTKKRI